jgi:hypothetical protein
MSHVQKTKRSGACDAAPKAKRFGQFRVTNSPQSQPRQEHALADLAARIRSAHEAARLSARQTIQHALAAGELLLEAKALVGHGLWGDWLHQHCDVSERTAQAYMRLSRNRLAVESNPQPAADLTIKAALEGLAKPRPSVEIETDPAVTDYYLPDQGKARIGTVEDGKTLEIFGVIESVNHPGYFFVAHVEIIEADDYGVAALTRRPVRADAIGPVLRMMTRHPDWLDGVEWDDDCPASSWPFPSGSSDHPDAQGVP